MKELAEWDSFYVIVGTSAGALIGLQFVVMTLIAEAPTPRGAEAGAAFGTPTVVHFGAVLLLAALLRVPWRTIMAPAVLLGLMGLGGVIYATITIRRVRRQSVYEPEFEDWLFHALLPAAAYAVLVLSAAAAPIYPHEALFGVGAVALLLLFIAIHNAWDTVAYQVFVVRTRGRDTDQR